MAIHSLETSVVQCHLNPLNEIFLESSSLRSPVILTDIDTMGSYAQFSGSTVSR